MARKIAPLVALLVLAATGFSWWRSHEQARRHVYTGFVEGEERLLRGEVAARAVALGAHPDPA